MPRILLRGLLLIFSVILDNPPTGLSGTLGIGSTGWLIGIPAGNISADIGGGCPKFGSKDGSGVPTGSGIRILPWLSSFLPTLIGLSLGPKGTEGIGVPILGGAPSPINSLGGLFGLKGLSASIGLLGVSGRVALFSHQFGAIQYGVALKRLGFLLHASWSILSFSSCSGEGPPCPI